MKPAVVGLSVLFALGCGNRATPGPSAAPVGSLAAGAVARVGNDVVTAESVGWVAGLSKLPVEHAAALLVRDALFAAQAREEGLADDPEVRAAVQAALARALLRDISRATRAEPPTDEEVRATTERHWVDVDHGPAFRVVHAVVRFDPAKVDAATKTRAESVAEALRRALVPLGAEAAKTSPPPAPRPGERPVEDPFVERFKDVVKLVSAQGLTVTAEALPAVLAEGRLLSADGGLDPSFAAGVAKLAARGDVGGPIQSSYGTHVAMLLEIIPEVRIPFEQRRGMFREEITNERARALQARVRGPLRAAVALDPRADALLAEVAVDGNRSTASNPP